MLLRAELVAPPVDSVVSLGEAKAHLRVSHDDEDAEIAAMIDAATAYLDGLEGVLGRALGPQTWRAVFAAGSCTDRLPIGPVISRQADVTLDGETTVDFLAGYPDGIPAPIRAAILLHIGSLYQHREQTAERWEPTRAYEALLTPFRRWV